MITVGIVDQLLTRELRRSVLRPESAPSDPLPGDDLDPAGVHLAAVENGVTLCTCFVYLDPCPWAPDRVGWHLRQMATRPERRGQGLGGQVVEAASGYTWGQGGELLWCNARILAVPFYARHGFAPHGPIFTDGRHRIAHRGMARELRGWRANSENHS
jgi:GNAT superfamily N-acetyltransferase